MTWETLVLSGGLFWAKFSLGAMVKYCSERCIGRIFFCESTTWGLPTLLWVLAFTYEGGLYWFELASLKERCRWDEAKMLALVC